MSGVAAFSTRTMRPEDWAALRHFKASEFNYPSQMGYEFMLWLDELRDRIGFSVYPSSDHRPPARNAAAGGATQSAHMDIPCDATDFGRNPKTSKGLTSAQRFTLVSTAIAMGCRRIGIYENGSVHLDRAGGDKAQDVLWVKVS